MKTTFDLPPELVRAMKLQAINEGRKLKDLAADLLRRGLAVAESSAIPGPTSPGIKILSSGLPVVRCSANAPARRMSADDLLTLERESLAQEDLQRSGHAP